MTGRGIDQIMPHPCAPELHEDYARSAIEYLAMAESRNGAIPRSVEPAYIWGDALAEFDRVRPAARIINLETSVTVSEDYAAKGINYRMNPANLGCIAAAKIDCCVLANNHVLDWGRSGLDETVHSLRSADIPTAGAGSDATEAWHPCIIEREWGRVLVFACAAGDSGVPNDWAATASTSGVALLENFSDDAAAQLTARIRAMRQQSDIAVLSIHWGGNWGYPIPSAHRQFAHALIDHGAIDLIYGHSSHHRKAIEVYGNKPILYGCGDFINDYEGIGGYEKFRPELVLLYFVGVDPVTHELASVEMAPFKTCRFRLERAGRSDAQWLANEWNREGKSGGTGVRLDRSDRLHLEWEQRG